MKNSPADRYKEILDVFGMMSNPRSFFSLLERESKQEPKHKTIGNVVLKEYGFTEAYRKKWNISGNDYVQLYTKEGVKISENVYRVGGVGFHLKDKYFMLIKYYEGTYITQYERNPKDNGKKKNCFSNHWVILNSDGVEKVQLTSSHSAYLTGGPVYSINQKYYNIETGEYYCESRSCLQSNDFIFLEHTYNWNKEETPLGVYKISKKDGTFEIFPITK
jgi:hypothetical protein